jgi:hypothetical protein
VSDYFFTLDLPWNASIKRRVLRAFVVKDLMLLDTSQPGFIHECSKGLVARRGRR